MDNQQHRTQGRPYGMPPLFALDDAVFSVKGERIVENKGRSFERDSTVLPLVDPVLLIYKLYNRPPVTDSHDLSAMQYTQYGPSGLSAIRRIAEVVETAFRRVVSAK